MGQCASEPRPRRAKYPKVCDRPERCSNSRDANPSNCRGSASDAFRLENRSQNTSQDVKVQSLEERRQGKAVIRPRCRYGWTCGGICTGSACTDPLRKPEIRDRSRPIKRQTKPTEESSPEAPPKRQRASPMQTANRNGGSVREIKLHHTTGKAQHLKSMEHHSPVGKDHWVDFNDIAEQWTIGILDSATNERTDILVWDFYTVSSVRALLNEKGKKDYPLYIQRNGEVYELPGDLQLRRCPWIGEDTELISLSTLALSQRKSRKVEKNPVTPPSATATSTNGRQKVPWDASPQKAFIEENRRQQFQLRPSINAPIFDTAMLSPATPFSPCSPLGTPTMMLEDLNPGKLSLDQLSPLDPFSVKPAPQSIESPFKTKRGS
mmetsp:Transcript_14744/g.29868  ORF Transcript_14744/g.29868 Transcript_14744/m.29868 type:complete len:379 (-) Transcript_14744:702-1838(-)|eukprot:CAMPEP_0167797026 /NCGR_PEP_ID=MMETSP0111_2-20121227/15404_1 /TAXON_ID=91324 /ORGANISM="Lotharella globosa, Strain CCCM811" /LENGTH=378 /DNA_ID=CAMNT_0007691043 /DNA_START=83 /DNA_END=1219 /DNA_ORIENTATION=-